MTKTSAGDLEPLGRIAMTEIGIVVLGKIMKVFFVVLIQQNLYLGPLIELIISKTNSQHPEEVLSLYSSFNDLGSVTAKDSWNQQCSLANKSRTHEKYSVSHSQHESLKAMCYGQLRKPSQ